jgi:hypothetical protein
MQDGLHFENSLGSLRGSEILNNVGFGIYADALSLLAGYENTLSGNGTDRTDSVPVELTLPRPQ